MWQTEERMIVFGIDSASLVTGERDVTRLVRRMLVTNGEDENSEEPSSATERHEFRGTNGCLKCVAKELLYSFQFVVKVLQRR